MAVDAQGGDPCGPGAHHLEERSVGLSIVPESQDETRRALFVWRGLGGAFTLEESAADVLALADALGWGRFAIVGHSMSALVSLHLAQHHSNRIEGKRQLVARTGSTNAIGRDHTAKHRFFVIRAGHTSRRRG